MSIHMIDDERALIDVTCEILELLGYQTTSFQSAEQYLTYMCSDAYVEPRLIITDIRMGGMDGFALIKEIRKTNTSVKIMIMSAYHECLSSEHAQQGFDARLPKPFDVGELESMVAQLYVPEIA